MKIQSKDLFRFLLEAGVLEGSEEDIQRAKAEYRRQYKRDWNKKQEKSKTLRPAFTRKEFEQIEIRARLYSVPPTTYARDLILSHQEHTDLIPQKDRLFYILQSISMSQNALVKNGITADAQGLLQQAEEMLLEYLSIKGRYGH